MRRILFSLQVFVLMCTPLPQASYAAVGLGQTVGLSLKLMLALYLVSDVVAFLVVRTLTRRVGLLGLGHLRRRLPRRLSAHFARANERAARSGAGALKLPGLFAAGYANLYLVAVIAGLSRVRLVPAMLFGIAGDLIQFVGTLALAGALARTLPFPGADWAALMAAPLLAGCLPGGVQLARATVRHQRRARPIFLRPMPPPLPRPIPIVLPVHEWRPR